MFIVSSLLAHDLSGCNTVPVKFGIAKGKLVKALWKFPLIYFGNINAQEQEYTREGKLHVARCCAITNISSMENR